MVKEKRVKAVGRAQAEDFASRYGNVKEGAVLEFRFTSALEPPYTTVQHGPYPRMPSKVAEGAWSPHSPWSWVLGLVSQGARPLPDLHKDTL